jgi:hypothetical protein
MTLVHALAGRNSRIAVEGLGSLVEGMGKTKKNFYNFKEK